MDTQQAQTYATARGFDDWTGRAPVETDRALLRASDYMAATYRLRAPASPDEQSALDAAHFLIARDLLTNPQPLPSRAATPVLKESREGAGFKKSTEYADAPQDPYPHATNLLRPLMIDATPAAHMVGRLVRR